MFVEIYGYSNIKNDDYKDFLDLRRKIYVEDLGYDKFAEFDGLDNKCDFFILKYAKKSVGVLRYTIDNENIIIDRFGILKDYRSKALGSLLLRFVLDEIKPSRRKIFIISSENKFNFFKIFGFTKSSKKSKIGNKELLLLELKQ